MPSSFWLLGVESRDFSQAEKDRTACKAEQIHKMTTIFTENDPGLSFCKKHILNSTSENFWHQICQKNDAVKIQGDCRP